MIKFKRWGMKDARWYEFWMPQSGLFGGMLCGAVIFGIMLLTLYWGSRGL